MAICEATSGTLIKSLSSKILEKFNYHFRAFFFFLMLGSHSEMPLPGDHIIFLDCPLEIVIGLGTVSMYVCHVFKQKRRAFLMVNKGIK